MSHFESAAGGAITGQAHDMTSSTTRIGSPFSSLSAKFTEQKVLHFSIAYFVIVSLAGILLKAIFGQKAIAIFGSFWASGNAANHGLDPYRLTPLVWVPDVAIRLPEINLNPPAMLPLFQLFALADPLVGALLWSAICIAAHIFIMMYIVRQERPTRLQVAFLFSCPIFLTTLNLGQIYTLMLGLGVGTWYALKRGDWLVSGLMLGILVAFKPNFALVGVLLFAARHYRPAIVAGIVSIGLSVLPILLYGHEIYQKWFDAIALDQHAQYVHDVSLHGFLVRAGAGALSLPFGGAVLLMAIAICVWRKPDRCNAAAIGIVVAIICSPMAWIDYLVVLAPAMVSRRWDAPMLTGMLFLWPVGLSAPLLGANPFILTLGGLIFQIPVWLLAREMTLRALQLAAPR